MISSRIESASHSGTSRRHRPARPRRATGLQDLGMKIKGSCRGESAIPAAEHAIHNKEIIVFRTVVVVIGWLVLVGSAQADVQTKKIAYKHGDLECQGYLA